MDRSKPNANHRDIICGTSFEPNDVLQELSRLRHVPIEIIKSKQEDAHELLCQLLSEIHDEICQILYNSPTNKNGSKNKTKFSKINLYCFFRRIYIKFRFININS
jgi:predicted site-specific integrase-resolvase